MANTLTDLEKISDVQRGIIEHVRQREEGHTPGIRRGVTQRDYLSTGQPTQSRADELEIRRDASPREKGGSLKPLSHWTVRIQKEFDRLPERTQRAWLDSFKIVEKGYVKHLNALKDDINAAGEVLSTIEPYYEDIIKLGISPQDYINHLIRFDYQMGINPARQVAELILRHNIQYEDVYPNLVEAQRDLETQGSVNKYIDPLKQEIQALKNKLGGSNISKAELEAEADRAFEQIRNFYSQVDEQGNELYPYAFENIEDIMELVQTGENLEDAYDLVMSGSRIADEETPPEREYRPSDYKIDKRDVERDYLQNVARSIGL